MVLNAKKSIIKMALFITGLFVVMFFCNISVNAETFDITVYITNPEGGTVSYNGISKMSGTSVSVDSGTMAPFFIEPAYGYKVGTIKYSGGSVVKSGNLYTTPAVTGNTTLYVTFEQQQSFEIQLDIGIEGFITDEQGNPLYSSVMVDEGEKFRFRISPVESYGVKSVKFSGKEITPDADDFYSITPTYNGTLTVTFDEYYPIEFIVGNEGVAVDLEGYAIDGTVEVIEGAKFKFRVDVDDGYGISSISYSYGNTIKKLTPNSDGVYTVSSECSVYITFEPAFDLEIVNVPKGCKLTAKKGTDVLPMGKQTVVKNSNLSFSTSTEEGSGYVFKHFKVTSSSGEQIFTENEITFQITDDTKVEAVYENVGTYNITVICDGGGKITQKGGYSQNNVNVKVNKGDSVTFEIVPESGFILESLSYSGTVFTKNDDGTYTTEPISDNQTLEVVFKGKTENISGIEVTDKGTVVSLYSIKGAEDVFESNNGNTIRAPMGDGILPAEIQYGLIGKSIWLDFYSEDYSWNINGLNIKGSQFKDKNLTVSRKNEYAPAFVTQLLPYEDKYQIHILEEGLLGFDATLNLEFNPNREGKTATIFKVDMSDYSVSSKDSSLIDSDGNASFVLSEGGNYMVVISDSAISDSDIHSVSGDGKVDTGSKQLVFAIVLVILLIGVGGIVAYALIKLNK